MRKLIIFAILLLTSNSWADNESLDIEFSEFRPYQSCNVSLGVMHEWKGRTSRDEYDALFPNGELPECINNEFPEAWVERRTPINKYGETICKIPCNIRSLPLLSNTITNIGHINGSQEILILELIELNDNVNNYHTSSPWHNYWYSFMHEGKKLYIHTENVSLED
jgi:hypothetical protein